MIAPLILPPVLVLGVSQVASTVVGMTRNKAGIGAGAVGFAVCLAIFLVSLSNQQGLIAALACLAAWLELFIVISTVGDAISDRQARWSHAVVATVLAVLMVVAYAALNRWG